ncbi:MAG: hypothetical protein O3A63_16960 [Proteobacteria bacterium]|nr:hypothetical protein [Pseudomonadota bacterium]
MSGDRTIQYLVSAVVLLHLLGNLWHGDAHTTLEINLPGFKMVFVIVVILVAPVLGAIATWTRFATTGYWAVGLSLAGSVLFSVYHHYVMISIDNVDHLPPGTAEAHAHFANSAEFIALIALAGGLLAFYGAGRQDVSERKSRN